ncbi:hypothetical protein COHA_003639 [Chlorella ohadii]|uniref:AB hydrolase-1 domain-containing protein n=1 Tax=Chlorella ohadii TaxID=2649997 RepID=A0AAD5DUG1_9CHLO|nr:hypothetical protein COHA_003639 [Chlorella ohadii]
MAANGSALVQPRPAAVPSSAYLSASSSVASLHTAPSSQEPEVLSIALQDGRALAYALMGAPIAGAAAVCIYHHGVPASLIEAEPLAAAAAPLGIAVVAFDRPGMGGSSHNPQMSIQSVVDDTRQLMDHLGLHSAVQVGESGGVPYAAACAALLPRRTQALLLLAGLAAVHGRENAVLLKSLSAMDRFSMNWAARLGGARLISHFVKLAADGNEAAQDWLLRFMTRAYRPGVRGVLLDYRVLGGDWGGLDVGLIACRTAIWHGAGDCVVAPAHAQWWHRRVAGSELHILPDEGHISVVGRHAERIWRDLLPGQLQPIAADE